MLSRQSKTCRNTLHLVPVVTRSSRHVVVAPILAAPLLTNIRRSTVGSGTREDIVCDRSTCSSGGIHRTIPACASIGAHRASSCSDRSTCASGGAHRTSFCCIRSTCARSGVVQPVPAAIAAPAPGGVHRTGPAVASAPLLVYIVLSPAVIAVHAPAWSTFHELLQ